MDLFQLLSFLGASMVLTILPGPDNIFVITESIAKGKEHGIALSFGLSMGVMIHTMAAATGLSLLIQHSPTAYAVIKYAGAAYLFYLAAMTLKEKSIAITASKGDNSLSSDFDFLPLARTGFIMNVLNPKVSLFFIAFLPQFVRPSGFNIVIQMMLLGLLFIIQAFLIFSAIAMLASKLRKYLNDDIFWVATKYGKAIVLVVLAIALAFY